MADWKIDIKGRTYNIPHIAVGLMLIAILIPAVKYSITLKEPSAAELLVAISISLFASVLFLWILDATSILPFRADWISKSVYTAAIVSILGTSVGVYGNYFAERKYPYEGEWYLGVTEAGDKEIFDEYSIILMYSKEAGVYWGYSNVNVPIKKSGPIWIEIRKFLPLEGELELMILYSNSEKIRWNEKVKMLQKGKRFKSVSDTQLRGYLELMRRK